MLGAILALSLFGAARPLPCPSARFVTCADTRALDANPGYLAALRRFVGDAHGRYLHGDQPLYEQVLDLTKAPQGIGRDVGGGARLFAGCKRFDCPEKAAVLIDGGGIVAIGIVNYRSSSEPRLDVIVRHADTRTPAATGALRAWATAVMAREGEEMHSAMTLHGVVVRTLDTEVASADPEPRHRFFNLPSMPQMPKMPQLPHL